MNREFPRGHTHVHMHTHNHTLSTLATKGLVIKSKDHCDNTHSLASRLTQTKKCDAHDRSRRRCPACGGVSLPVRCHHHLRADALSYRRVCCGGAVPAPSPAAEGVHQVLCVGFGIHCTLCACSGRRSGRLQAPGLRTVLALRVCAGACVSVAATSGRVLLVAFPQHPCMIKRTGNIHKC